MKCKGISPHACFLWHSLKRVAYKCKHIRLEYFIQPTKTTNLTKICKTKHSGAF